MADSLRVFIGFGLSTAARVVVARAQQQLREVLSSRHGRVRWLSPDDFHLTLRFIGNIPTSALPDYARALERALSRSAPVTVYVDRLLGFPSARHARTLVLGFRDPGESLGSMASGLEQQLAPLGVVAEARPLVPHVTLARVSPAIDMNACVDQCANHDSKIMLSRICLFESRSPGRAARYVPRSELQLGTEAPPDLE
jgi:2'-5' RNA ligase